MNILLKRAKERSVPKWTKVYFTKDEIELAVAWIDGEITSAEYLHAIGSSQKGSTSYARVAQVLRNAVKNKQIKIIKNA